MSEKEPWKAPQPSQRPGAPPFTNGFSGPRPHGQFAPRPAAGPPRPGPSAPQSAGPAGRPIGSGNVPPRAGFPARGPPGTQPPRPAPAAQRPASPSGSPGAPQGAQQGAPQGAPGFRPRPQGLPAAGPQFRTPAMPPGQAPLGHPAQAMPQPGAPVPPRPTSNFPRPGSPGSRPGSAGFARAGLPRPVMPGRAGPSSSAPASAHSSSSHDGPDARSASDAAASPTIARQLPPRGAPPFATSPSGFPRPPSPSLTQPRAPGAGPSGMGPPGMGPPGGAPPGAGPPSLGPPGPRGAPQRPAGLPGAPHRPAGLPAGPPGGFMRPPGATAPGAQPVGAPVGAGPPRPGSPSRPPIANVAAPGPPGFQPPRASAPQPHAPFPHAPPQQPPLQQPPSQRPAPPFGQRPGPGAPPPGPQIGGPPIAPVRTQAPQQQQQQPQQQQPRSSGRSPSRSPRRGSPRSPKIDPRKLPRYSLEYQLVPHNFESRTMGSHGELVHQIPRRADSDAICKDSGSACPQFIRVTANNFPQSRDEVTQSHLPLAAVITPLAQGRPEEEPLPVIDCGPEGPTRCTRCRAYINPFVRWAENDATAFLCNLCGARGVMSEERARQIQRPELELGSVEYVAPDSYCARPPMEPWHVFVIDATAGALRTGALASVCAAVRAAVEALAEEPRVRVSIMSFDDRIQYYSIRGGTPRMMVVPDIQTPFGIPAEVVLVRPADPDGLAGLLAALDALPGLFAESLAASGSPDSIDNQPAASQAALLAAVDTLKPNGGKVHMFVTSLPNAGAHRLVPRHRGGAGETLNTALAAKQEVLAAAGSEWKAAAMVAAEASVCVDFAFLTQGYVDVAQHRDWMQTTGGTLYHYHPFAPATDYDELLNDLLWNVRREQALEGMLRVRCSQGFDVDNCVGHFLRRETDLVLAAMDCDKAVVCTLRHDERLRAGSTAYIQAALLYTTPAGQRRVRVHTLALPIASSLGSVFRGADLDATLQAAASKVAWSLPISTIAKQREDMENLCVSILTAYRRHCAARSSSDGQLILPESLKLLPLYMCMFFKCPQLSVGPPDTRAVALAAQMTATPRRFAMMVKPRLVDVQAARKVDGQDGVAVWRPEGYLTVTGDSIASDGVYLLENAVDLFLYIGPSVPDDALAALLGLPGWDALPAPHEPLPLPRLPDSPLNAAAHSLIDDARVRARSFMRLRVVCRGRPEEPRFHACIAEDRAAGAMSYIEFLCHVHKRISTNILKR